MSDIGYSKEKPLSKKGKPLGNLGNLVEFGAPNGPNGPLAPGNELLTSLNEFDDDFVTGLSKAVEDAERKAGL